MTIPGHLSGKVVAGGNNVDSADPKESWEVAATESGWWRADLIKARLEAEGIPVELKYEAVGRVYGLTVDGLGKVDILVPAGSIDRVREILSESFDQEELPWEGEEGR